MIDYFAAAAVRVRDAGWEGVPGPVPVQAEIASALNAGIKQLIKPASAVLTSPVPSVEQRWFAGKIFDLSNDFISWCIRPGCIIHG